MGDLVESFWLYGKDGAKYRAYIHQERISASSLDGPSSILGPKTARLANGPALNFVDDNTFQNAARRTADAQGRGPEEARVGEDEDLEK
jgi:hypothetical protein